MKTTNSEVFIFRRKFRIHNNKVVFDPTLAQGDTHVPTVSFSSSNVASFRAEMRVWAELVHQGENDPLGRDCLHVHLILIIGRIWVGRDARELLHTTCESAERLHLWLASMRDALLVANRFATIPRFSNETIRSVFGPLFDAAAALKEALELEAQARIKLWDSVSFDTSPVPHYKRFLL